VAARAKAKDLVVSPDGESDLLRFQMLGFRLFTWFYSLISVIRSEGLPEIPENMYVLMGISNAAYIGSKMADNAGNDSKLTPARCRRLRRTSSSAQ
jgi:hypothetical protein